MEVQNFSLVRGTAPRLRVRLVTPEDVSTWTTQFDLYKNAADAGGTAVLTLPGTITNPDEVPNSSALGVFDVVFHAADTAALTYNKSYYYTFRRTNSGFEDVLTSGTILIK